MTSGCFIVFEGIDGSGKTVQLERLKKNLEKENYLVVATKEPTVNLPIGRLIRKILYENVGVSKIALALLFAADRADHTDKKIKPALTEGAVVISDRYVYSSLAYQGKGMKIDLDLEWLKTINKYIIPPDIVIFLDITPEIGQKRLSNGQIRVQDHTYFEELIQQEKIREVYYRLFNFDRRITDLFEYQKKAQNSDQKFRVSKMNNTIILRIDGTLPIEKIENQILKYIKQYLEGRDIGKNIKNNIVEKNLKQFYTKT